MFIKAKSALKWPKQCI